MQGNLQQLPLPEVLQFISMGKSSGILHLDREGNKVELSIRKGKIISSSAIDRRLRLGELLVHRGILKRSELTHILKLQKKIESDKRLGQILIERDIVTEQEINNVLRHQLEEEMWNLFAWPDGKFFFENKDPDDVGDALVHIDIEPLILEGTRRNDEWATIVELLPHDRLVPVVAPLGENFDRRAMNLRPVEWRVLAFINSRFTIRAIINRSNIGKFEVHMALSQLVRAGLIEVKTPENLAPEIEHPSSSGEAASAPRNGNAARSKGGGANRLLGAFISSRGAKERNDGRNIPAEFHSPVGLLAYLANEMITRVRQAKEYRPVDGDDRLLEALWFDLLPVYSRADALVVSENKVDSRMLETYLQYCAYAPYADNCFEDAVEGLLALLQATSAELGQRVDDKTVSRIGAELIEEVVSRAKIANRPDYESLNERITAALRGT